MVLTNVYGAAHTIRATMPTLKETRGHLMLTGSVAGRVRFRVAVLATSGPWTGMGESARQELTTTGVRVTSGRAGNGGNAVLRQGAP